MDVFNRIAALLLKGLMNGAIDPRFRDCHFMPQYDYLYFKDTNIVEYVLRFENFAFDVVQLLKSFNDTQSVTEMDLNTTARYSHKVCHFSAGIINDTNKDLIKSFYRKDFNYFYPEML